MSFRNVAIIAHVDHGKTTLVDAMLKQSGTFRENESVEERVMDSNDQERERGITIYAKNTSIFYKENKINIVDTPGHADFGSEVERVLRMVDCVLLVVDAYEGPMPQTKFVLRKSLQLGLKPIVVINKIDKPTARPSWVIDQLFDLFVQLGATDEQLDFSVCYTIAREGIAKKELSDTSTNITPLFDVIMEKVEEATNDTEKPFRMQVANLGYDNFLGRLAIGRVSEGKVKVGQEVFITSNEGAKRKGKIAEILTNEGLKKVKAIEALAGDIVTLAGIPDIYVGETIAQSIDIEALPAINIDEPTLKMEFLVNNSPFAGKEGKFVTSRQIRDRLERELETNVGLKIDFDSGDNFNVSGRGELHLSVLIETMRREGYELQVGSPMVIMHEENGEKLEPIERVSVLLPSESAGSIIERLGKRKGEMVNMMDENGQTSLEFKVPTRGLLGFKSEFTTLTKGEGILTSAFEEYAPYKGPIEKREVGSMISGERGVTMAYSLWKLQERGPIFVNPATEIYEGMIIGEHLKGGDLTVNPCKNKQLTNIRASGTDEALRLTPPKIMTLEEAIDYIGPDEYVEVTPESIRLRKKYLTENERKKYSR
ncbi:translational GTPase TypA [Candidatus Gracilibacteria bacterium]|nr:translational GTPase TypA [Candidatus Gracilibacteria bacterium]NUJ98658.1 translational GTPase TypA [Candidatus Gracilibacteria bacterium]